MSEANGVLRNPYHPPGATIYIEKRLTSQSYRLFSQPLTFAPYAWRKFTPLGVMRCGRGLRTTHCIVLPRLTVYFTTRYSFRSSTEGFNYNSTVVTGRFKSTLPDLMCHKRRKIILASSNGLGLPFFLKSEEAHPSNRLLVFSHQSTNIAGMTYLSTPDDLFYA